MINCCLLVLGSIWLASSTGSFIDPTKPLLLKPKESSNSVLIEQNDRLDRRGQLKSILVFGNVRQAIIDNKIYREGDRYQQYYVKKIEEGAVVLANDSGLKKMYLFPKVMIKSNEAN